MIIPEDGCFPSITSSNLNAFNNIMIVKVDNKWIKPGETTFQLATIDRLKKGSIWPADNYIKKLIPSLPETKLIDEHKTAYDSKKTMNLSLKRTTTRPQLFANQMEKNYHFLETQKPIKKSWSDKQEKHNRFTPNPDINNIEPWIHPWDSGVPPDVGNTNALLATPTNIYCNFPNMPPNNGFQGFIPPCTFDNIHHNMSNALPSSSTPFQNEYSEYRRDCSPTSNTYNVFDEMPVHGPLNQYSNNNNYRQKSRNGPNASRFYKNNYPRNTNNHGPRHDTNFILDNDSIGRNLHNLHSSFTDKNMEDSGAYDMGQMRQNSKNTHYSRGQNNRKPWRNNGKFKHQRKPRDNINSLNSIGNTNANPRGHVDFTPREDVGFFNSGDNVNSSYVTEGKNNSFKSRGNHNSIHRFNPYNKNQRKPWSANKAKNFKPSTYVNQKVHQNFRGSNARQ